MLNLDESTSSKKVFNKKTSVISNLAIAGVLLVLSLVIFTTDLTGIYTSVAAPVYNGNKNQKNVSIMFSIPAGQDGNQYIEGIMDTMSEKGIGATFFMCGVWAMQNAKLVKKISEKFEIGQSGYSGKNLKKMSAANQKKEISAAHEAIKKISGADIKLFSPPSGSFSKTTLKAASDLGYTTIMWNKDTLDWQTKDADLICERATQNLTNGNIVLMTPTEATLEALPDIIDFYLSQGFNPVAVSENIM